MLTTTQPAAQNPLRMTSLEIAHMTDKRHDNVRRLIQKLAENKVIRLPQIEETEENNNLGLPFRRKVYVFEGEQGRRDTTIIVAQLSPVFTAKIVDRWIELERSLTRLPDFTDPVACAEAWLTEYKAKRVVQTELVAFRNDRGCGESVATINEVSKATGKKYQWRELTAWCEKHNVQRTKVWLTKKSGSFAYPAYAWLHVYGVDLNQLFMTKKDGN